MKHSCGAELPEGSVFCVGCGERLVPKGPEFIYTLEEAQIRAGDPGRVQPEYGSVAICTVENSVYKIYGHQKYKGTNDNSHIKDALGQVWEFLIGAGGKKLQKVVTYIMTDLRDTSAAKFRAPLNLIGKPDAAIEFEFWVTPDDVGTRTGLFLQKFVMGKRSLSMSDFEKIAIEHVTQILPTYDFSRVASDPSQGAALAREIASKLEQTCGISALAKYTQGKLTKREWLEVSSVKLPVVCGGLLDDGKTNCVAEFTEKKNFCVVCGNDLTDPARWVDSTNYLLAKTGEQITVQLRMMVIEQNQQSTFSVKLDQNASAYVLKILAPKLRSMDLPSLMTKTCLDDLTDLLNNQLTKEWRGYVTEFEVTDVKSNQEAWIFKTRALVQESLRNIQAKEEFLKVDEANIDLGELAFRLKMREIKQADSEALVLRRVALESKIKEAELEIEEALLNTQTSLKKEEIDDSAEKQRLVREQEKMLRERDFERDKSNAARSDEISAVDHDMSLEKKVVSHDLDLNEMSAEAQSRSKRRDISDEFFADEERIRIQAKAETINQDLDERRQASNLEYESKKLDHQDQSLDRKASREIDQLKVLADLKAQSIAQANQQELTKIKMDAEKVAQDQQLELAKAKIAAETSAQGQQLELAKAKIAAETSAQDKQVELAKEKIAAEKAAQKIESMKGLDPLAMLALQIADLKDSQNLGDIVSAITGNHAKIQTKDSDLEVEKAKLEAAKLAEVKQQELYKEMLKNQEKAMEMLQRNQSEAMDNMKVVASMNAVGASSGKDKKDDILSVAEKAMETMAQVASAAAGRKSSDKESGDKDSGKKDSDAKKPKTDE